MSDFSKAITILLQQEGTSFTDDPNDAGGATKFGITLADLKTHGADLDGDGDIDKDDVRNMTREQAIAHYEKYYWNGINAGSINSQAIASKTFSNGVNFGLKTGSTLLQKAANASGAKLVEDGDIGPRSLEVINSIPEVTLMNALVKVQKNRYWDITKNNINKKAFLTVDQGGLGWTPDIIQAGLDACSNQNLDRALQVLTWVKNLRSPHLEGNLRFLKGWLNRAGERYGI